MTERNLRGQQPLRSDELGEIEDPELHDALRTGRALDAAIDDVPMRVSEDFTRRVMAVIAREPVPGPVGFMTPLRRRGLLAGFGDSVRQAWAALGSRGVPSFARAAALAYVLVVAIAGVALTGVATVGVGSALGVFGPTTPTPPPAPTAVPLPTPDGGLPTPGPQTAPATSEEPGESEDPSDGPDASDDHGGNSGPGSSGSSDDGSGSDDGSSSGSGSGETATPRPTDTARPTGTPKPSQTPH